MKALNLIVHELVHNEDGRREITAFLHGLGLPGPDRADVEGGIYWVVRFSGTGLVQPRPPGGWRRAHAVTRAGAYVLLAAAALEDTGREVPVDIAAAASLLLATGEGGYR